MQFEVKNSREKLPSQQEFCFNEALSAFQKDFICKSCQQLFLKFKEMHSQFSGTLSTLRKVG